MSISDKLNDLMAQRGETAYRLSKETGISQRLIGYWKSGEKQPSAENIVKLTDHYGVTADYLLGNEQKETPAAGNGNGRETHDKLVEEAIQLMDSLSPTNRKAALKMLDALLESQKTEDNQ